MPHLSPMQWSIAIIPLWGMFTLVIINMFFMENKLMIMNKMEKRMVVSKWKW